MIEPAHDFGLGLKAARGVFSRSAVVFHHGEIGTTGQALAAGRPQLVLPFMGDQFDQAARIARLGVGEQLARGRIARDLPAALGRVLAPAVRDRAEALSIYRKAAEDAGLWNAPRWSPAAPGGKGRVVRAPLQLAGVTIPDALITKTENPVWDAFPNGVIGLPILRRFNIATIAKEEAVFLKRNALPALPERYNRAGLWIERAGQEARIVPVGAGSPAAEAGMAAGDRLIGVDFTQLVQWMFDPSATVLLLTVERSGKRRDLELSLRDYL